jgi:phage tail-like protein
MKPRSSYLVQFGRGLQIPFQEVSGPKPHARITKITGINKATDVTLKRGVVANAAGFLDWLNQVKGHSVRVTEHAEHGRVVATWMLKNARLVKFTAPDLNAKGTDVAIESVELTCEAIEIIP